MTKNQAKECIDKMLYDLSLKCKIAPRIELILPYCGMLIIRNKTAAVMFDDNVVKAAKNSTNI